MMAAWLAASLVGLAVLAWSADRFVVAAAQLAERVGLSTLVIGLTVVAFGTSAPEIVIAIVAAVDGSPGLAVGNALGSNIANIALVLGITALIAPLRVGSALLRREFPVLILVTLFAAALLLDGRLTRLDGALLLLGLVLLLFWLARLARRGEPSDSLLHEISHELPPTQPLGRILLHLTMACLLLLIGSRLLVWGGVGLAEAVGVPDLIIGLTLVAIGTSLPELAAAVAGALRRETDLVIGNIVGSNLFNLLAVLALPAVIAPHALDAGVVVRDLPVMIGLTLLLLLLLLIPRPGRPGVSNTPCLGRVAGGTLMLLYIGYLGLLAAGLHG